MFKRKAFISYFRNFIFGVEDSVVSTVGLLSGIAVAGVPRETILLTGVILIFVEAFSMAAGSFLAEESAEEYTSHVDTTKKSSIVSGAVMFVSYFVSGFIPLFAYLVWPVGTALIVSIGFSLATLLALGFASARIAKVHVMKSVVRMVATGGAAIAVGAVAGFLLSSLS